jgi:hypothetical protein
MDAQANDQVLAEVLLRSESGRSLAAPTEPVTAVNVTQYYSSDTIVHTATQRLAALGFDVVQQDQLGLTIEGNKALFERVFHTHLARQPASRPRAPRTAGSSGNSGAAPPEAAAPGPGEQVDALTSGWANSWEPAPVPTSPPGSTGAQPDRDPSAAGGWVATQPMVLPRSLRDVVDQVVLPAPATYHGG